MSCTGTSHRRDTWEASAPAAWVGCGLLTAAPSPLAVDGSQAPARWPSPLRLCLSRDAALSAVVHRARVIYPASVAVVPVCSVGLGDPDGMSVQILDGGVGCGNTAASIEATRRGEAGAACSLGAGAWR